MEVKKVFGQKSSGQPNHHLLRCALKTRYIQYLDHSLLTVTHPTRPFLLH
ncbi:hypothetical protein HanXRQr2_Chr02g0086531 [Helianthus annuus]|uniref:Uncharacterized protein n=1 Tax=Helianthus annuus TaxID=4232 RepID=A0A9K3JR57_HELAN|nr:hypothetical protein HanXRQr2_Chr02g0086531 [Helianthus annuus]